MSGGQFVTRAGDQIQCLGNDSTNRLVTADQAIYSLVESLKSLARDCDKLADVITELLKKIALKTKEFENKNAEINRLSAAREEELQSTIDRNLRVFKLIEELLLMCYYCIICDNVYCYVIAIVFVWEALNGAIALLCCHVSMKLDVGLTKPHIRMQYKS